ncbi:hypothetical protein B0H21DRAFT_747540 [Amylocystis lapponica]|nr:hypothetical protein B0H21DRAFT_747540 [Amylocystis lapponica]
MPTINFDESLFEHNVRFKIDNIRDFLDVPADGQGPQDQFTETFGQGWRWKIEWQRVFKNNCSLRVILVPPEAGCPQKVYFSIRTESLMGKRYSDSSTTVLFPPNHSGYGVSKALTTTQHWRRGQHVQLRTENACVVVATVKTSLGRPQVGAEPVLNFIHSTIKGVESSSTQFVTFSRRTSSDQLSRPRIFFANGKVVKNSSTYIDNYLNNKGDRALMHRLTEDMPVSTTETDYTDLDSDFDEDEEILEKSLETVNESTVVTEEKLATNDPQSPEWDSMQLDGPDPASLSASTVDSEKLGPDEVIVPKGKEEGKTIKKLPVAPVTATVAPCDVHIVTGVASATWEALLFYLYTGNIKFAPLTSEGEEVRQSVIDMSSLTNPDRPAPCSCKSIYRLADKMNLELLRDCAIKYLQSRLSVGNILEEVFSVFTSRYEEVQKMEFAVMMQHWDNLRGTSALSAWLARITSGDYPHASWVLQAWSIRLPSSAVPLI